MVTAVTATKRKNGQYFTKGNCFKLVPFTEWFNSVPNSRTITLTEPFAGCGDIPKLMYDAGYSNRWALYDLYPQGQGILRRDSIACCPTGECIITNPPYLARNSATRRGLGFPDTEYDDVYKLALDRMLASAPYVAAIIPESFVTSGLFLNRVSRVISIKLRMFDDTDCPVCIALFSPGNEFKVYSDNDLVGSIDELRTFLPIPNMAHQWEFNAKYGDVGLVAVDSTVCDTIRFVPGNSISSGIVKVSSRAITRIQGDRAYTVGALIDEANSLLCHLRDSTQDVFLTSFKGMRRDGKYRRRLDYGLARSILDVAYEHLELGRSVLKCP